MVGALDVFASTNLSRIARTWLFSVLSEEEGSAVVKVVACGIGGWFAGCLAAGKETVVLLAVKWLRGRGSSHEESKEILLEGGLA